MRVQSAIPRPAPATLILPATVTWPLWSRFLMLFTLLVLARATRAQSPDGELFAFGGTSASTATTAAAKASFAYDGGSRCAGTAGIIVPALGAATGSFSAQPAGLSLDPVTGVIDLAQSQAGAYTITHQLASLPDAAASTFLVLNALPTPVLTASGPATVTRGGSVLLKASGGSPGTRYQFFNNGQTISGTTTDTYLATTSGSYTVLALNPGSCVAASAAVAVTVHSKAKPRPMPEASWTAPKETARSSKPAAVTLTVFPNPATGSFTVAIGSPAPTQLTVYTTLGEKLDTKLLPTVNGSCTADLSHLARGVYILQATTAAGSLRRRVVRE